MRTARKADCLRVLREQGLEPRIILDVGILAETEELRVQFKDVRQYLFEPVEEFFPLIRKNYAENDYELISAAASNVTGSSFLEVTSIREGQAITHTGLTDEGESENARPIETIRLDDFVRGRKLEGPFFLKVDVDGAELQVLEGASGIFDQIDCIMVEAARHGFAERVAFLTAAGFSLIDIVEICYYGDMFHQADLVFLRSPLLKDPRFNPWLRGSFDATAWQTPDTPV